MTNAKKAAILSPVKFNPNFMSTDSRPDGPISPTTPDADREKEILTRNEAVTRLAEVLKVPRTQAFNAVDQVLAGVRGRLRKPAYETAPHFTIEGPRSTAYQGEKGRYGRLKTDPERARNFRAVTITVGEKGEEGLKGLGTKVSKPRRYEIVAEPTNPEGIAAAIRARAVDAGTPDVGDIIDQAPKKIIKIGELRGHTAHKRSAKAPEDGEDGEEGDGPRPIEF